MPPLAIKTDKAFMDCIPNMFRAVQDCDVTVDILDVLGNTQNIMQLNNSRLLSTELERSAIDLMYWLL